MIKGILKRLLGQKTEKEIALAKSMRAKTDKAQEFLEKKIEEGRDEYHLIRSKMKNLRETNYKLGLQHMKDGHLIDATFRFRMIRKFWPDLLDAHYQLAYCLLLKKKPEKAKEVLQNLVKNHPDCDPKAHELLSRIENATAGAPIILEKAPKNITSDAPINSVPSDIVNDQENESVAKAPVSKAVVSKNKSSKDVSSKAVFSKAVSLDDLRKNLLRKKTTQINDSEVNES